jgi:hypothetical protein
MWMILSVVIPLVQYTVAVRDSSIGSLANELQVTGECRARDQCAVQKMQEYANAHGEHKLTQALKSSFEEECLTPCEQFRHWEKVCASDEFPIENLPSKLKESCVSCTEQEVRDECDLVNAANNKVPATKEQCMSIPVAIDKDKALKRYSQQYCQNFNTFMAIFSNRVHIENAINRLVAFEDEPGDAVAEASAAVDAAWQHLSAAVSSKSIDEVQAATQEVVGAKTTLEAATRDQASRTSARKRKHIEMAGVDYMACVEDKPTIVDVLCSSYAPICGQTARPVWSKGDLSC